MDNDFPMDEGVTLTSVHRFINISVMQFATSLKSAFFSTSPILIERLSVAAIHESASARPLSHRFYNNFLIGVNYAKTAARYSKCYLCKLPLAKPIIRKIEGMTLLDSHLRAANLSLLAELPPQLSMLRRMGGLLKYPNRNLHSALGLVLGHRGEAEQQVRFLGAVEAVTLGFALHNSVGGSFNPNPMVRIGLTLLRKVVKDKYLVLAGDYLHIRGSVLASETGTLELPKLLADTEVALCKQVHLQDELREKIGRLGYESVTVQEIHEIARLRASPTTACLKGMAVLGGEASSELFETIGLLVLLRRELEEFMFNFPRLLNRFVEVKTRQPLICEEYTLTQYLFFHSAQQTRLRLDLAYLNTVHLLGTEIAILEDRIREGLGQEGYEQFQRRLRYTLIMYS